VASLGRTFQTYREACFESSGGELAPMNGPGNNFITKDIPRYSVKEEIKASAKTAKFQPFQHAPQNLKDIKHDFKREDCLEGSLPALALFLHRDPHTFASMSLDSNHRSVNPSNFLLMKDEKPPIVEAIRIPGNNSFQTSEVVIGFYVLAKRTVDTDEPCLRSIATFDFQASFAGKSPFCLMPFVPCQTVSNLTHSFSHAEGLCRGAFLVDKSLTGAWPTLEDWSLLEYVLNQTVVSMLENTKLCPVESKTSLSQFIDRVFRLEDTWTKVLGFQWSASWQNDFLTFQLFFQFLTEIRQMGIEGNHRQELTNRVNFGFNPTDTFPLKPLLRSRSWTKYDLAAESTVNQAVKLSIIRREDQGKRNFVVGVCSVPDSRVPYTLFFLPTLHNKDNDKDKKITLDQLKQLRSISESITESKALYIVNDWSHVISAVIDRCRSQKEFELISEKYFVYEQELKPGAKATKKTDKFIEGQICLHQLITEVLFSTQPGKEAVAQHGLGADHTVTMDGWNKICIENKGSWIGYCSSPHPVVSCLKSFGISFVPKLILGSLTIRLFWHKQTLTKGKTMHYAPSSQRYKSDLPREQYEYWKRPEIFVIYWLFFAVGFTEEGMEALHDLISTRFQDFNDPVFWLNYIISPVNTITEDIKRMLPSCVNVTFRAPINRKAHQLWRYKTALSYIKTIVEFGDQGKLNKTQMNSTKQPYLHALVSSKKFGKFKYETESSDKKSKNNYVDGFLRAFLISFPEKFKDWADKTINAVDPDASADATREGMVDKSAKPCQVQLDARVVWGSYRPAGVFASEANYDIPTNWDAYHVFNLINRGHPVLTPFTTETLKKIKDENQNENTPKKRKKTESKWCLPRSSAGIHVSHSFCFQHADKGDEGNINKRALLCGNLKADMAARDFHPKITSLITSHLAATKPREPIDFRQEAHGWFKKYMELSNGIRECFGAMGFKSGTKLSREEKPVVIKLEAFYREKSSLDGITWEQFVADNTEDRDSSVEQQDGAGKGELAPADPSGTNTSLSLTGDFNATAEDDEQHTEMGEKSAAGPSGHNASLNQTVTHYTRSQKSKANTAEV
jgi:hypothetical protein